MCRGTGAGARPGHDVAAAVRTLLLAARARGPRGVLEQPAGRYVRTAGRQGHGDQRGEEPAQPGPLSRHWSRPSRPGPPARSRCPGYRALDDRALDDRVLDAGALNDRVLGPGEPGAREARAREPGAGQSGARRDLAHPERQRREDKFRAGLSLVWPERQRRADELLAGHPGHGQPEDRTLSAFPPGLQPAVVQPGVLERDGQAKPRAAGRPGPRGVRSPEPVEHHLRFGGPEAHPMVADGYGHRVPVPRHGDDHVPALAVLDRVVQQVAQDALDPAAVHLRDARLGGQPEIDPGPLPRRELLGVRRGAPDQIAHVGGLRVQCGRVRVVAADLEQVGEQRLEPFQLAFQ